MGRALLNEKYPGEWSTRGGKLYSRSITKPINHAIEGLSDGSEQVASASAQVSSASQSLAEGSSEQASGLEETSSSLEEMSSMTSQNADNARQAKTMMGEAQQVNELTLATQEAFKRNVEISGKIGKLIDKIAAASQEQAQGVGQINKAVAEMDKVVQKNAASAEESASAAAEMSAQTKQMREFVDDLAALVGGRGDGHGLNPAKDSDSLEIRSGPLAAASHRSGNVGKRAPAAPKKMGKKMEEAVHKPKAAKPEQMIPLEEGDFKEF